jgi:hypothetical protein
MISCEQNEDIIPSSSNESQENSSKSSDDVYYDLATSFETVNFFQVKLDYVEIVQDAINRGNHIDSLRNLAISSANGTTSATEFDSIMFGSQLAADNYYSALDSSISLFINQDTIIEQMLDTVTTYQVEIKNINFFFDNFHDIDSNYTSILADLNDFGSDTTTVSEIAPCGSWKNVLLTATCALACSFTTSGLGTPFCGWLCWCAFCSDSWLGSYICAD